MQVKSEQLKSLAPGAFEQLVAQLLAARGFRNVVSLGGSGDEGIDLRAEWLEELPTGDSRMTVWAVQCKRYSRSLSQQQIRDVLNAALEPPLDLLPSRPDFFLVATSSTLSPNSRRIVERANNDRSKYGCMFVVWDGETIAKELSAHKELVERFFLPPAQPVPQAQAHPQIRLSILMDEIGDRVLFTFLCDLEEASPVSLMARSEVSDRKLTEILKNAGSLSSQVVSEVFDQDRRDMLRKVGTQIATLIPSEIRSALFGREKAYVRLASNTHNIPFELAYDEESERFLGASLRIGRIQITESARIPTHWPEPSILIIGPSSPPGVPSLPMAEKEVHELSAILSAGGIPVTTLSGDLATRQNLESLLADNDYKIIHFSGHGIAEPAGTSGIILADGPVPFDEVFSKRFNGSIVFLSACGSGGQLNEVSQKFFRRGGSSVLGFIGPVTDEAARRIAEKFYDELSRGATLGDAMHAARRHQESEMPKDFSWISVVLFGDPTARFTD